MTGLSGADFSVPLPQTPLETDRSSVYGRCAEQGHMLKSGCTAHSLSLVPEKLVCNYHQKAEPDALYVYPCPSMYVTCVFLPCCLS